MLSVRRVPVPNTPAEVSPPGLTWEVRIGHTYRGMQAATYYRVTAPTAEAAKRIGTEMAVASGKKVASVVARLESPRVMK